MKARERNSSEFPAPAITICSNLFARNETANFFKSLRIFTEKLPFKFSKEECFVLVANVHWCQPAFGRLVETLCGQFDIERINVLDIVNRSALTVISKAIIEF